MISVFRSVPFHFQFSNSVVTEQPEQIYNNYSGNAQFCHLHSTENLMFILVLNLNVHK